jgi:hypothetical protein
MALARLEPRFELLSIPKGVHGRPKSVVGVGDELPFGDQPLKWLNH